MPHRVAAVVMAAVLMISCSPASPTTPTPSSPTGSATVRFTGTTVDYITGQAMARVKIDWTALTENNIPTYTTTTTDASGRFDVTLPAGSRYLFSLPSGNINLGYGTLRTAFKHLDSAMLATNGPCAARYGYVFDAVTRRPIAGARVTRAGTATTDANGYYRIDIGCEQYGFEHWGVGTTTIGVAHPSYTGAFEFDGRAEGTSHSGVRRVDFALQPLAP